MKAISLWQPWAAFIAGGFKTIETRTHDRFKNLVGQRIAIHAAKKYDHHVGDFAFKFRHLVNPVYGVIVCTAYIKAARWLTFADSSAALIECSSPRFGLFLESIQVPYLPIPCKGKQGIFEVEIPNE